MARIEWVDARLMNWARWKAGEASGRGLGYAAVNLMQAGGSSYREARIPVDDHEAVVTNMAVEALEPELKRVVEEWYLRPGPPETLARDIGIGVSTLYARRDRAHARISAFIGERERRAMEERARVEGLQRRS